MNSYENMAFGLKIQKVPKEEIEERVMAAAKILNVESLFFSEYIFPKRLPLLLNTGVTIYFSGTPKYKISISTDLGKSINTSLPNCLLKLTLLKWEDKD